MTAQVPVRGITKYSWSFPGGNPSWFESEIIDRNFTSAASTEYNTPGEKVVTLNRDGQ